MMCVIISITIIITLLCIIKHKGTQILNIWSTRFNLKPDADVKQAVPVLGALTTQFHNLHSGAAKRPRLKALSILRHKI